MWRPQSTCHAEEGITYFMDDRRPPPLSMVSVFFAVTAFIARVFMN